MAFTLEATDMKKRYLLIVTIAVIAVLVFSAAAALAARVTDELSARTLFPPGPSGPFNEGTGGSFKLARNPTQPSPGPFPEVGTADGGRRSIEEFLADTDSIYAGQAGERANAVEQLRNPTPPVPEPPSEIGRDGGRRSIEEFLADLDLTDARGSSSSAKHPSAA